MSLDSSIDADKLCAPFSPIYKTDKISNELAIGTSNGRVHVINVEGELVKLTTKVSDAHSSAIDQVLHLDDSDFVYSMSKNDLNMKVWNINTGNLERTITIKANPLFFTLEPTTKTVWVAYSSKELILYNMADGSQAYSFGILSLGNIVAMSLLYMDSANTDYNKYIMIVDDTKKIFLFDSKLYKTQPVASFDVSSIIGENIKSISNIYNTKKLFLTTDTKLYLLELQGSSPVLVGVFAKSNAIQASTYLKDNMILISLNDQKVYQHSYDAFIIATTSAAFTNTITGISTRARKGSESAFAVDCNAVSIITLDSLNAITIKYSLKLASQINLNGINSMSADASSNMIAVGDKLKSIWFIYDWSSSKKIYSLDMADSYPLKGIKHLSTKIVFVKNSFIFVYAQTGNTFTPEFNKALSGDININKLAYDPVNKNFILPISTKATLFSYSLKKESAYFDNYGATVKDLEYMSALKNVIICGGGEDLNTNPSSTQPNWRALQAIDLGEIDNGNFQYECNSICEMQINSLILVSADTRVYAFPYTSSIDALNMNIINAKKKISKLVCFAKDLFAIYFADKTLELWDVVNSVKKYDLKSGIDFASFSAVPSLNILFAGEGKNLYIWNFGSAVCSCPDFQFLEANTCKSCDASCESCSASGIDACTLCKLGYFRQILNSQCLKTCPSNSYPDSASRTCKACDSSCSTCTGPSNQNCKSCKINTFLTLAKCVTSVNCPALTFPNTNTFTCDDCMSTCDTCDGASTCLTCKVPYYSTPSKTCVDSTACPLQTYPNSGTKKCESCNAKCDKCEGPTDKECTGCLVPLYLYNKMCLKSDECPQKTFFSTVDKTCMPCDSSCLTCTSAGIDQCNSCEGALYLTSGKCVTSSFCPSGTFPDIGSHTCKICEISCSTCSGGTNLDCLSCKVDTYLQANSCVLSTACIAKTYPEKGTWSCAACLDSCATCEDPSTCLTCVDGKLLAPWKSCVDSSACPQKTFPDLVNKKCQNCDGNCLKCDGPNENSCTDCLSPLFLYQKKCIGSGDCPEKTFFYSAGSTCMPCFATCLTCSSSAEDQCKTCLTELFFYSGKCYTSSLCPEGTYPLTDTMGLKKCDLCYARCKFCKSNEQNKCTSCQASFFMLSGSCVTSSECPSKTYPNSVDNLCSDCDISCKTCSGPTPKDCNSCKEDSYKSTSGECIKCNEKCQTCRESGDNNCIECKIGFFFNYDRKCVTPELCPLDSFPDDGTRTCKICDNSCATCSGELNTNCKSCKIDTYLTGSKCVVAADCPKGTYPDAGSLSCKSCLTTCDSCDGPASCLTCKDPNLMTASRSCVDPASCPLKTFADIGNKKCEVCNNKCEACDGPSANSCTSCLPALFLYQKSCLTSDECPLKTFYSEADKTCKSCFPTCLTCVLYDESQCKTCIGDLYFANGKCVDKGACPERTYAIDDKKLCAACHASCLTCSGDQNTNCITCSPTLLQTPLKTCITKESCSGNYYPVIDKGLCNQCDESCNGCTADGNGNCVNCKDGFFFNYENLCVPENMCPKDSFADKASKKCQKCFLSCATCSGIGKNDCLLCATDFIYDSVDKECFPKCLEALYYSKAKMQCDNCYMGCIQCRGSLASDCLKCQNLLYLTPNFECVQKDKCPIFTYPEDKSSKCALCYNTCERCIGDSIKSCSLCKEGLFLNLDSECVPPSKCPEKYYPRLDTRKCEKCDKSCLSCIGPLASECKECNQDYFKTTQNLCVLAADCPQKTFASTAAKACSACFQTCLTCSAGEENGCKTCVDKLYLGYESKCVVRQECPDAVDDAKFICLKCDDKCEKCEASNNTACTSCKKGFYLYNSDCVNTCPVGFYPEGVMCQLLKVEPRLINILLVQDRLKPERIYIQLTEAIDELSNETFSEMFISNISLKIAGLGKENFIAQMKVINNRNIQLDLSLKANIRYIDLEVDMGKVQELEFNRSKLLFDSNKMKLNLGYPNSNLKHRQDLTDEIQTSSTIANVQMGVMIITYFSSSIFYQILALIASLVNVTQLFHILLYINVNYPYNLVSFFHTVGKVNLNFMPDFGKVRENIPEPGGDFSFFGHPVRNQRAPRKFDYMGKTSSFILDALTDSLILLTAVGLFVFIKRGSLMTRARKETDALKVFFSKGLEIAEYKLLIQVGFLLFYKISLSTFLQFQNPNFEDAINICSFLLALICFLFSLAFLLFLFKTAITFLYVFDNNINMFEKCKDLFDLKKIDSIMQRLYILTVFLKKYITVFFLVFLHDKPDTVIISLISLQILYITYMVEYKPWEKEIFNILEIMSESIMFIMLILVWRIYHLDHDNKEYLLVLDDEINERFYIGWTMIYLFISLLFVYFLSFILMIFRNLQGSLEDVLVILESKGRTNFAKFLTIILCSSAEIKKKLAAGYYKKQKLEGSKMNVQEKFIVTKSSTPRNLKSSTRRTPSNQQEN